MRNFLENAKVTSRVFDEAMEKAESQPDLWTQEMTTGWHCREAESQKFMTMLARVRKM